MENLQLNKNATTWSVVKLLDSFGVKMSKPDPWCILFDLVVARDSYSPTVTLYEVGQMDPHAPCNAVTPCHLMHRLGITTLHQGQFGSANIDPHWSVYSYLWAMKYHGINPIICRWPKEQGFPKGEKREGIGYDWGGENYRPEYALVSLLSFRGWNDETVQTYVKLITSLPDNMRLHYLRKSANYFLQDPVDSYSANGFHRLFRMENVLKMR